jgi:hypothetical protein
VEEEQWIKTKRTIARDCQRHSGCRRNDERSRENDYVNIAIFFRSINSKSIAAPSPGSVGAWTMPSRSISMS